MKVENLQRELCTKYNVEYVPLDLRLMVGISDNFFSGKFPLNGLRHLREGETCGWYLWAGEELSDEADFFKPMHLIHLVEQEVSIVRYLGLPAGWRFLVAENYEDVWFDKTLIPFSASK